MLMRTDPFRQLDRLADVLGTPTRPAAMPIDAYRKGDVFLIQFDLPGVKPDSIDLTVEQNVLTVRADRSRPETEGVEMLLAERPQGTFSRQLFLGETLDTEHIQADYVRRGAHATAPGRGEREASESRDQHLRQRASGGQVLTSPHRAGRGPGGSQAPALAK